MSGKDAQSQCKLPLSASNLRLQNNTEHREDRKQAFLYPFKWRDQRYDVDLLRAHKIITEDQNDGLLNPNSCLLSSSYLLLSELWDIVRAPVIGKALHTKDMQNIAY